MARFCTILGQIGAGTMLLPRSSAGTFRGHDQVRGTMRSLCASIAMKDDPPWAHATTLAPARQRRRARGAERATVPAGAYDTALFVLVERCCTARHMAAQ